MCENAVKYERLFSSAGYIARKARSWLEPNAVNKLVCLCIWLSNQSIKSSFNIDTSVTSA